MNVNVNGSTGTRMILNQTSTGPGNMSLSDFPASTKHCVFRCGDSWFSVPAVSVRQIAIAPELVQVPNCHRALVGLGRLRSEFVPVIALGSLLDIDQSTDLEAQHCLLVLEGSSAWSLLISESAGLESMETIVSQEARAESTQNAVIGTAMFRDRIVRVLDPNGLLATAQLACEKYWNRTVG